MTASLTPHQQSLLGRFKDALVKPMQMTFNRDSAIMTEHSATRFSDILKIHHATSTGAFSKANFEYGLLDVVRHDDPKARLAPQNNPGHDIEILGRKYSLKSQADKRTKRDRIMISKFMELGKGDWELEKLRELFIDHLQQYDSVLMLRYFENSYELVEIPKLLLLRCETGELSFSSRSKQKICKSGSCRVQDEANRELFQLYFDGGSERKLQVKNIDKSLCVVHASWELSD